MNPSPVFDAQIAVTLGLEGGYSDDPADHGGQTNWGITDFAARAFGYTGDMRDMSRPTAVEIYRQRYFIQPKFNLIEVVDARLAGHMLDAGINLGPAVPSRFLQRALNVLSQNQTMFPSLTMDGVLGPATLAALHAFVAVRGDDGRRVLLGMVCAQQSVRYIELAERDPSQERFEYGWQLNRALVPPPSLHP